ncbi:MAG: HNH endonuclease [Betaproteobacteria bacterium]
MTAPPEDKAQLEFLQHVQRIFDEGEFVATYKFALLIALVELAIERGEVSGAPLELDLQSIAEKFIEQYWPHAAPYAAAEGAPAVLVQSHGAQAAIVKRITEARERFGSLARAKTDRSWHGFVASIARIVKQMPLWKLQTLRRRNVPFLYGKSTGPRITLLPGVAFNLRRFGALVQLLARSAWVQHIRANPRNAPAVGGATDLELFLFGGARVDLSAARQALQEMQENRCFYCASAMKQDPHVDHFIPWSRYPRDLAQNFVLAHDKCNLDKGDLLSAPAHLARWVARNRELGPELAARLAPAGFLDDQPAATQVARWAYSQAEATSAQLWVSLKYTVNADGKCLEILGG